MNFTLNGFFLIFCPHKVVVYCDSVRFEVCSIDDLLL